MTRYKSYLLPLITFVVTILLWQLLCVAHILPPELVPAPSDIAHSLIDQRAVLWQHSMITLQEALCGLFFGVLIGVLLALVMDAVPVIKRMIYPFVLASQTIPTIALAPLLILWFGFGLFPKVLLVVVTTFFPITIALLEGFASVSQDSLDLFKTMKAKSYQIFYLLKLPSCATYFFSGLKMSATYAVIAAVVSEWLGGTAGLGVYMIRVRKSYSYDKLFACVVLISLLSLVLMLIVELMQKKLVPWTKK